METSAAPAQDGSGEGWRITDAAGRRGRLVVRRFDLVWFVVILAMRLHRERGRKSGGYKKSASLSMPTLEAVPRACAECMSRTRPGGRGLLRFSTRRVRPCQIKRRMGKCGTFPAWRRLAVTLRGLFVVQGFRVAGWLRGLRDGAESTIRPRRGQAPQRGAARRAAGRHHDRIDRVALLRSEAREAERGRLGRVGRASSLSKGRGRGRLPPDGGRFDNIDDADDIDDPRTEGRRRKVRAGSGTPEGARKAEGEGGALRRRVVDVVDVVGSSKGGRPKGRAAGAERSEKRRTPPRARGGVLAKSCVSGVPGGGVAPWRIPAHSNSSPPTSSATPLPT